MAQDPFASPSHPAAGADAPSATPAPWATPPADAPAVLAQCEHVTSALCAKQNGTFIGVHAGYVVLAVLLAVIWRLWWNKRGTGSAGKRFLVPMLGAAVFAGALAALDPARSADVACCLAHGVFRAEILLQGSPAASVVLLGVLPALLLYTVVVFAVGALKK